MGTHAGDYKVHTPRGLSSGGMASSARQAVRTKLRAYAAGETLIDAMGSSRCLMLPLAGASRSLGLTEWREFSSGEGQAAAESSELTSPASLGPRQLTDGRVCVVMLLLFRKCNVPGHCRAISE